MLTLEVIKLSREPTWHIDRRTMKRKSKLVVLVACLLMATPSVALAAKSGSKSESASAAWLVDGTGGFNTTCTPGGDAPAKLLDSVIDNEWTYVWIKSSSSVNVGSIQWQSFDKGRLVQDGDLDPTGHSCGQFELMAIDAYDVFGPEDLTSSNDLMGTGSITFKFSYLGKNFSSDTATFID